MTFFSTIANVKGAFIGALLGNNSQRNECGFTKPCRPVYVKMVTHNHHLHPAKPTVCQTQTTHPCNSHPHPHPHPVNDYSQQCIPSYPLCSLSR